MKKDTSRILHDRYFSLTNRTIQIVLRNGKKIRGIIIGFVNRDADDMQSPVRLWHIVEEKDRIFAVTAVRGLDHGTMIRHRDILSVTFEEDNSIIFC